MVPQDYRYELIHEVFKRNHLRQEVAVALVTYTPLTHAKTSDFSESSLTRASESSF